MQSTTVTAEWLLNHSDDENLRIYDCALVMEPNQSGGSRMKSGINAYLAGHIKGAAFLDLTGDFSNTDSKLSCTRPTDTKLQEAARAAGMNNSSMIVLYASSHPMWATRIWWMLSSAGVRNIALLDGALASWQAAGGPLSTTEDSYPPGDITLTTDPARWADAAEVQAAMATKTCTINALTASIHDGTSKNIYGRPGHIPGSRNVSFQAIVDSETGLFLKPSEWQQAFAAIAPPAKDERVLFYCGAGVAATCDAFALTALGYTNIAVYDGSMEEWGGNPDLPVAQGAAA